MFLPNFGQLTDPNYPGNPILGVACRSPEKSVGDSICISPPGGGSNYTVPTSTPTTTSSPADIPAPIPTDVALGTNTYCSLFHEVRPEEYCNLLLIRYAISMIDFLFLNSAINPK